MEHLGFLFLFFFFDSMFSSFFEFHCGHLRSNPQHCGNRFQFFGPLAATGARLHFAGFRGETLDDGGL